APDAGEPPAPAPRFVARSVFCPPAAAGTEEARALAVAASGPAELPLRLRPDPGRSSLPASGVEIATVDEPATLVTGYGGVPAAGARTSGRRFGAAAAPCTDSASPRWHFAEGSSSLTAEESLLVHNPFPDEAIVRVLFFTPTGVRAKANLADLAIPPGGSREVVVNDFIFRRKLLAATVEAERGRVVAWRLLVDRREDGRGIEVSAGAPAAATTWYFPDAPAGPGARGSIAVLNPSAEHEAAVTVTLVTEDRVDQPRSLVEVPVAPGSVRRIELPGGSRRGSAPASAIVTSANGVGVVAERLVRYTGDELRGVTAETGATEPALRWLLGPVAREPRYDELALVNPGPRPARVHVTLAAGRRLLSPGALDGVRVRAGLRATIPLGRWTRGEEALAALVEADEPVIVERRAFSTRDRDVAAAIGSPLRTPRG
ncbi:MAG TPA: DUF5719 family protein, partial [Actinomycetota bacterium]|nr:DUF5719 family protein [Actinomycetota bacterium]